MHISLDSALGRQRRLNSVGESVLQIAPNAAAAYSLRSLTGGDPRVVRVRRSSNNAEQDFTSSGVSSGALTSFVNEIQTLGTVTNSVGNDGFTLTNKSSTGFTATTDTATGVCGWPYTAKAGDKITVSFDAVIRSGTPQFIPRKATALSGSNLVDVVSDSAISVNSTASYSFEFTYDSDEAGSLTFSEGDDNADFDINNFQVTAFKGAGFVETWYDQSGNIKHAVQATAANQPKIVNAGILLPNNGIDFDGSGDILAASSLSGMGSVISVITASIRDSGTGASVSVGSSASSANTYFATIEDDSVSQTNARNTTSVAVNASVSGTTRLTFSLTTGQTSTKIGALGGTLVETTSDYGDDFTSGELDTVSIGELRPSSGTTFNGRIREILVYNSDQTDNRGAIEANIANHYNITLV